MRNVVGSCLCLALVFVGCQATPAPPVVVGELHPVAQMVREQLDVEGGPFGLLVTFDVRADATDAFERALLPAIAATWTEPGNHAYELARIGGTAGTYVLYERWRSVADLDWHLKSQPIVDALSATADMADVNVEVLTRLVRP